MKFDILLPLLNWIGMLLEKNVKYVVNLGLIVKLISKTNLPQETSNDLANEILEILEKILTKVNNSNLNNSDSSTNPMFKEKDSKDSNDSVFKYYV
jgi:hypothetical protein